MSHTPPLWVLKRLHEIDPWCRIGYAPEYVYPNGVTRPWFYALIKLFHEKDLDKELMKPPVWDNRGPIFNYLGTTERDWDINRVPCFIAEMNPDTVVSGDCIQLLKRWTLDSRDFQYWHYKREAKHWDDKIRETARQCAEEAIAHHRRSEKTGDTDSRPIVAKKFMDPEQVKFIAGDYDKDFQNPFLEQLRGLVKGWKLSGWTTPEERGLKPPADLLPEVENADRQVARIPD